MLLPTQGGYILGVGPTWGTTAGDPTSNLGRLGPQLLQQVAGDDDDAGGSRGHGGVAATPSSEQPSLLFPQAQAAVLGTAGGRVDDTPVAAAPAATDGNASAVSAAVLGVSGGHLSEGDADVRGIAWQVVHEDADNLPAGFERAGVAADSAAVGPDDAPTAAGAGGRVRQLGGLVGGATGDGGGGDAVGAQGPDEAAAGATAVGFSDGVDGGGGGSDPGVEGEYGPHEVDGVEAGAIDKGGFEPASYVRHR